MLFLPSSDLKEKLIFFGFFQELYTIQDKMENIERVLKGKVAYEHKRYKNTALSLDASLEQLCLLWSQYVIPTGNVAEIWNYVRTSNLALPIDSSVVGKFSTIKEYENKKGFKHMAHFNGNGKYIGTVSKLGKDPVSYKTLLIGLEQIQEFFTINMKVGKTKEITDIFIVREKENDDDDDTPIILLKKSKRRIIDDDDDDTPIKRKYPSKRRIIDVE